MASFGGPITRDGTGTIRRRDISLSTREKQLYAQLWAAADKDNSGFITGNDAVPFFAKSGLSPQILSQIWVLADADNKGVLGQQGFSIAVKLIAHAQNGKNPSSALIDSDAPLPRFEGITSGDPPASASASTPVAAQNTGSEPPLTSEDKTKYGGMFVACGPVNGLLDGDKAREVFMKSKLPLEALSQIWNLADTKRRGSLDIADFTIAMYYIQHTMDKSIKTLPTTLPPSLVKACIGSTPGPGLVSSPVMSPATLPRQLTGNNMNIHNPSIGRQLTGPIGMASSPLAQQNTGGATSLLGGSSAADVPWDITSEEKTKFDRFFDSLDKTGTGFIGGEEAGKFFLNSRLPEAVLAQIWDLADITGSGSLSRDEFAVAMLLINRKNAHGTPIPRTLPLSLIPPSLRNRAPSVPSSVSFPAQDPIFSLSSQSVRAPQGLRRQSFDLLGDGPSLGSSAGNARVDKDLIGTEDLTSKITSESGELASMQNQINNLTNVTGDLQAKRTALDNHLKVLLAQKQDISIRLNQIKTLHESERNSIKELESRHEALRPQVAKLREELEVSERELMTTRANKDEFLLSLANDQEESNQIRTRLRQNHEETAKLREELEAKKKDTSRQKGLLEIARRQLATSEAEKQNLLNEIAQESEKARGIQSQSPAPTSSPVPSSASIAPPLPAPRGSRKEAPPPPASRGTISTVVTGPTPDVEEAFGIPEALRSPTGSFKSVTSPRLNAPASISRQSTGSSPFDQIPRQGTGSSPFESISRQGTGSSPFETIPRQGTGMSAKAPSITSTGAKDQDDFWSSASAKLGGQTDAFSSQQQDSTLALAAAQALPTSPPVSQDPFGSMAFPSMDTPPVTKMDFDAAFQGFSASKSPQSSGLDGVKSAEAFAEAFPDIDSVDGFGESKTNRASKFGFEDDFSGDSPFTQTREKPKEDDEFPPIVEMNPAEEDSSDDSDDDNEEAFVQAKSSVTSPEAFTTPIPAATTSTTAAAISASPKVENEVPTAPASVQAVTSSVGPTAPAVAPVSTGSSARKLTAADFSEFESAFGGPTDDFESAFKGVELSAPKVSSGATAGGNISGFDDGFDFNASFDDAFGSSSSPFGNNSQTPKPPTSSTLGAKDLDEAFGGFGGSNSTAAAPAAPTGAGSNAFGNGFGDFEAEFFGAPSTPAPSTSVTAADPSSRPVPSTPAPAKASSPSSTIDPSAAGVPAPPQVPIAGVDELMNMGFTKQQAQDALMRYDTVERAANFLLGGE
ncbi:hypothetical protein B0O80DRAFT_433476 [Mortierella sp. GBAus27b]|nr:hypothetical protein B0O80DRAFT_433476 [Mortierella sp. GBAus27b]